MVKVIDARCHATRTLKDVSGRNVGTVYDDGSFTRSEDVNSLGKVIKTYDQRMDTDPAIYTERRYDDAGRLTDVYLPPVVDAISGTTQNPHWHYTYDASGNELTQVDPKNHTTTFTYNDHGQRLTRTMPADSNPGSDSESWDYYTSSDGVLAGLLKTHTDFKGQTTKYIYDTTAAHGGRLIEEQRFTGAATGTPVEKTVYHYDALGRRDSVTEFAAGNMTTSARSVSYEFDTVTGQVIKVTNYIGTTVDSVLNHAYKSSTGQLIRTWTANNDTTYDYDVYGRLWHVTATKLNGSTVNLVTTYTYDAVGNLDLTTFDNGTATTADDLTHDYDYDNLNRLDTLVVKRGTTALFSQDYDYQSNGQKDNVTEVRGSDTTVIDWTYDAINRLTVESYNAPGTTNDYTATYSFDLASNRITKTQTGYQAESVTSQYNDRDELTSSNSRAARPFR